MRDTRKCDYHHDYSDGLLAYEPRDAAALALSQELKEALAKPEHVASSSREVPLGEQTIVGPTPSLPDAGPEPHDVTMYFPAERSKRDKAAGRPRVRVTVLQCGDAGVVNESFEVGDTFEIGREGRDLRAIDLTWSRRHALIEYTDRGYVIRDLGSTGGTYVNGRRVRADATEPLFLGAQIAVGRSILTFSSASDPKLPDLTGVVIADRYLLERLLRNSSKGAAYSARQQTLPVRHALKLLSPTLLDYPGYRERFRREAEVAIDLSTNPIIGIKPIKVPPSQTLPFDEDEMAKILDACDRYPIKGLYGTANRARMRALTLLLRYSGLRIRDAVTCERKRLVNSKLLLYQAKTGTPVYCPLPPVVVDALTDLKGPNPEYFFLTGNGLPKSAVADAQRSFRKLWVSNSQLSRQIHG